MPGTPITPTILNNAADDAGTFSSVVNGTGTITTRLGATIPSLAKTVADAYAAIVAAGTGAPPTSVSTLTVAAAAQFNGNITGAAGLDVTGVARLRNAVQIDGVLHGLSNMVVDGYITSGLFTASGLVTAQNGIVMKNFDATDVTAGQSSRIRHALQIDGLLHTLGAMFSDGAITAGSTMNVAGLATFNGGAAFAGTTAFSDITVATSRIGVVPSGNGLVVTDNNDNILIAVTPTQINHPDTNAMRAGAVVASSTLATQAQGANGLVVTDAAGNILLDVNPSVVNHPDTNAMRSRIASLEAATATAVDYGALSADTDIAHIMSYGQSLSVGIRGTTILTPSLTYAYKFVGGVRAYDPDSYTDQQNAVVYPADYASLVAFGEQLDPNDNTAGETPVGGTLQMIAQLLLAENGIDMATGSQKFLGSAAGRGGYSISQLKSGTPPFTRMTTNITSGKTRADELSKTYNLAALTWTQGEYDYQVTMPRATYRDQLRQLRADIEASNQAATSSTRRLPMVMYQVATHTFYARTNPQIALAQLDCASDPYICLATPCYFLPFSPDGSAVHLSSIGYKWLGAYYGLALKRWLYDRVKIAPLVPVNAKAYGANTYLLHFNLGAKSKLVLDTTTVANPANYGFSAGDASGADVTVSSVSLVGKDVIKVVTAAAAATIRYAWISTNGIYAMGNVRDNQGDTLVFDPSGINKPMHRWAPIFEIGVS